MRGKLVSVALPAVTSLVIGSLAVGQARHQAAVTSDPFRLNFWSVREAGQDLYAADSGIFKRGRRDRRYVLLTFDDGPHPTATRDILNVLRDEKVPATFFVVGRRVLEQPSLTRRILDEGHELANHSFDHIRLDGLTKQQVREDLAQCELAVQEVTGRRMVLMRPPGMRFNENVLEVNRELGYILVHWNAGVQDFTPGTSLSEMAVSQEAMGATAAVLVERAVKQLKNGTILLLHDNPVTAKALPEMIRRARAEGFEFVTSQEMLGSLPDVGSLQVNPPIAPGPRPPRPGMR